MKNVARISALKILYFFFLLLLLLPAEAFSQKITQQETLAAFPESVSGIFKNSCVACHSDQSNSKSKIFMNLSDWDKLKTKKQVKTGKRINKEVAKGAMPPEGFLKKHPEAVLSQSQVESISAWSKSIRSNPKN
jgi:cytochrome c5